MNKQVGNLTVRELETLIQKAVRREMVSIFNDPDYGLALREEIEKKLKLSLSSKKRYALSQIKKDLGAV